MTNGFMHAMVLTTLLTNLSLFRIKIEDVGIFSSPLLAWACIRLDRLCQGFRVINLSGISGKPVDGGKLLVKIDKTFID